MEELFISRSIYFPIKVAPCKAAIFHVLGGGSHSVLCDKEDLCLCSYYARWMHVPRSPALFALFSPLEADLVPFKCIYICLVTWTLSHFASDLALGELFPFLEVPVSRLLLMSRFTPQGALVFEVLISSLKTFFILEILILSSRSLFRSYFFVRDAHCFSRSSHLPRSARTLRELILSSKILMPSTVPLS